MPPKIIFQDEDLMVLEKPPGLVVDKSETQSEGTLENWLEEQLSPHPNPLPQGEREQVLPLLPRREKVGMRVSLVRQGIVHRLDKDTSGLILVAKTPEALENLQTQFQDRVVKKEYLALVHGHVTEPGKVEGAIERNPGNREKFTVLEDGKEAVTDFSPEGNFQFSIYNLQSIFNDLNKIQTRKLERMHYNQFTLVRCFPHTGRTHQIRVHLKHIGFPIVSDEKYGGRKVVRLDKRWCPRQFLHAAKIGFNHPKTGEWMEFTSELPEDLQKALKLLS